MLQKNLNEENNEIKTLAYELYEKHGFKSGNDFVDWLEAEKMAGNQIKGIRRKRAQNILFMIVAILCIIVAILLMLLFQPAPKIELSEKNMSELKLMMLVLDPKADEKIAVLDRKSVV